MERLTYWCPDGKGGGEWRVNVRETEIKGEEIDRLAAYEDIGMEPEKLKYLVDTLKREGLFFATKDGYLESILMKVDGHWTNFSIPQLQDFLRAREEDRLVVLPYKAADKDSRFYLTRLQSLSATEKNAFLMGRWNCTIHPCEGCNTGWGSASADGVHTCNETCERLAAWNKKQEKED